LTAAAGGNPNTNITASPVVGQATTAVSPNTQITFTPTPVVVGAATTAAPVNATPIPYTPLPQGAAPTSWTLHEGEFPYCIARRYNLNPEYLLSYPGNEWTNGAPYFAGQVLIIPPASDSNRGPFPGDRALRPHNPYTVTSSNETMYSIACLFGDVDPAQLAQKNGLSIDATLPVGKVLQIP
jgi:LysM repeat protein